MSNSCISHILANSVTEHSVTIHGFNLIAIWNNFSFFIQSDTSFLSRDTYSSGIESKVIKEILKFMIAGHSWWRHQMEIFSVLLALCAGNSPVPVNSPHIGQWRGALMFSLIFTRINGWVNNRQAGDLRRHLAHYDVTLMFSCDLAALWMVQSVCPSATPFWQCSDHHIIMKCSGVIAIDKSDAHGGQVQRSKVKVTEVKTQLNCFRTATPLSLTSQTVMKWCTMLDVA